VSDNHEEGLWTQKAFKEQAQSLAEVIRETGNPFLYDNAQLLVLDSRDILNESVINTVRSVEKLGADQYKSIPSIGHYRQYYSNS